MVALTVERGLTPTSSGSVPHSAIVLCELGHIVIKISHIVRLGFVRITGWRAAAGGTPA
jgi:hypothetical protein